MPARTYWGKQLQRPTPPPPQAAGRAKRAIDYERRAKGYVFGALQPHTGAVLTGCYDARSTANYVDFLQQVDTWLPAEGGRVYAIMENRNAHKAADVLLFAWAHPRWEFVFQPT